RVWATSGASHGTGGGAPLLPGRRAEVRSLRLMVRDRRHGRFWRPPFIRPGRRHADTGRARAPLLSGLGKRTLQQDDGMDEAPSRTPRGDQADRFPALRAQPVQRWNRLLELGEIRDSVLPVLHL